MDISEMRHRTSRGHTEYRDGEEGPWYRKGACSKEMEEKIEAYERKQRGISKESSSGKKSASGLKGGKGSGKRGKKTSRDRDDDDVGGGGGGGGGASDGEGADEYEVEKIVDERVFKGVKQYFAKWVGWDPSYNTWEVEEAFEHAPSIMKEWRKLKAKKERQGGSASPSPRKVASPSKPSPTSVTKFTRTVTVTETSGGASGKKRQKPDSASSSSSFGDDNNAKATSGVHSEGAGMAILDGRNRPVKAVVGSRLQQGVPEYLIEWVGDERSWVPSLLCDCPEQINEFLNPRKVKIVSARGEAHDIIFNVTFNDGPLEQVTHETLAGKK